MKSAYETHGTKETEDEIASFKNIRKDWAKFIICTDKTIHRLIQINEQENDWRNKTVDRIYLKKEKYHYGQIIKNSPI